MTTYIKNAEESRRLNDLDEPAIIISPSGMCEGGRILHHLIHHVGKPSTNLLFVGYQAQHTLGRRLLEGAEDVKIFNDTYRVRARVKKAGAYSAHADREELIDWIETVRERGRPKQVFLVHGDEEASLGLADALGELQFPSVHVPERGSSYDL